MPRRFVTRADIDAIADGGQSELLVDDLTTVTDIAREHARERGVRLVRQLAPPPPAPSPRPDGPDDLEAAVRAAVVGRLGHTPEGLDAILRRVLAGHVGSAAADADAVGTGS